MKPRHCPRHRHRPCLRFRFHRRRRPGRRRRRRRRRCHRRRRRRHRRHHRRRRRRPGRRRRRRPGRRQLSSWYVFITVVYSFYASRFQGYSLFENVTVIFFLILGKGVYFKI